MSYHLWPSKRRKRKTRRTSTPVGGEKVHHFLRELLRVVTKRKELHPDRRKGRKTNAGGLDLKKKRLTRYFFVEGGKERDLDATGDTLVDDRKEKRKGAGTANIRDRLIHSTFFHRDVPVAIS